ncbi:hypothetical protein GGF31_002326 [Allomyces arbusculus]|nr:hypothetical protein GGF31_002326 [Allomyces arbusculus]
MASHTAGSTTPGDRAGLLANSAAAAAAAKPSATYSTFGTLLPTSAPPADPAAQRLLDPSAALDDGIELATDRHVKPPTLAESVRATIKLSYLNVLLVFVPLGILADSLGWGPIWTFWLNFLAIVPLAKLLGFATEELALHTSQTVGGLLNATFGNAVEVIVSIVALQQGQVQVVQSSLLGSILSNLLLVTGFCFLCGGYYHRDQYFNATAANTSGSLLTIAVMSLLVPAAFVTSQPDSPLVQDNLLSISHGIAVIMLIIYAFYLWFQLSTHASLFAPETEEESEEQQVSLLFAGFLLLATTIAVAINSGFLVSSIEGLTEEWNMNKSFVGLILLPIVGNAAEHVTAVTVSMKNKLDLALGVAIGSSMQIALLVIPILVIIGWAIGQPMSLYFQTFDTTVLFISVLITVFLIQDGRSNWLEGMMMLAAYGMIALTVFFQV